MARQACQAVASGLGWLLVTVGGAKASEESLTVEGQALGLEVLDKLVNGPAGQQ